MIHIYCGDGKGKTTAAVGIAIRNVGSGGKVIFAQFMKGGESGEINVLDGIENIEVLRVEKEFPFVWNMTDEDKTEITKLHNLLMDEICKKSKDCSLVVLDEVTYPYGLGLVDCDKVDGFVENTKAEIVITGRNPSEMWVNKADYVTEMRCVKHPFEKGVCARKGIEY